MRNAGPRRPPSDAMIRCGEAKKSPSITCSNRIGRPRRVMASSTIAGYASIGISPIKPLAAAQEGLGPRENRPRPTIVVHHVGEPRHRDHSENTCQIEQPRPRALIQLDLFENSSPL